MHQTPDGKPREISVVVVDDDAADQLLARYVLEGRGLFGEILTASSAEEGLKICREWSSQGDDSSLVVFLDLWMPRMTGFDFLEEIDRAARCAELRVPTIAILTSSCDDRERARALSFQTVVAYIEKPLREEDAESLFDLVDDPATRTDA